MSMPSPQLIAAGFLRQYRSDGLSKATEQLAAFILENRIHSQIEDILLSVEEQYSKEFGVVEAEVTAAHPLSASLKKQLEQLIIKKTNAKKIILHEQIDKSVLGGVKISTQSMELDLTLGSKLDRLRV